MTNRLIPTNAEPLYRQLMARIRDDVSSGVYPAESQIPSEQEMCARYGVSRVTVRRAISELTDEGILRKQQGKGTFVCTPNTRSIEADGKREEWKGSSVNDGWTIKLTTTLLEINASNLKRSFGTADVTDAEKKHTIKIRTDIKDADYIESLVWVGDTSKGYVLIAIKNALNTAGATLTWTDKGEGTIPVEFTAHQDGLETDGYAPCEVIFFDPAA